MLFYTLCILYVLCVLCHSCTYSISICIITINNNNNNNNYNSDDLQFLSDLGRQLVEKTGDVQASSFLFQWILTVL